MDQLNCPQCKTKGDLGSDFIRLGNNIQCKKCAIIKNYSGFILTDKSIDDILNTFGDMFGGSSDIKN